MIKGVNRMNEDLRAILEEAYEAKQAERAATAKYEACRSRVLEYMSEHNTQEVEEWPFTAKLTVFIRHVLDSESLRRDYPVLVKGYSEEVSATRFTVKKME